MKKKKFEKLWKRMSDQIFGVSGVGTDRIMYYNRDDNLIGVSFSDGKRAVVKGNLK